MKKKKKKKKVNEKGIIAWLLHYTLAFVHPPTEKRLLCLISNVQTNGQVGLEIQMDLHTLLIFN